MVQRNQQGLKKEQSYIKAPANLCDDRVKFKEALILYFLQDYKLNFHIEGDLLMFHHWNQINICLWSLLQYLKGSYECGYNNGNAGNND